MSKILNEFVIDGTHMVTENDHGYDYYFKAVDVKGNEFWKYTFTVEKSGSGGFLLNLFLNNLKSTEMK